ncbi:putative 4-hydroxy-4-methyl-2-oxoglutarate aldolase 2 [Miscanthus floridulus]|uniref:putative 4-hydroxy-4-methyl-2-oxoglutarate aldolase 2 n=1 Tax=Miscanthus floridulus TaxID=154761 RepID=UPI003459EA5E
MGSSAPLAIADICDANSHLLTNGELRPLPTIFQIYGRKKAFSGPVATVKCFEDNVLVRELVAQKGHGRVMVIDGCGSLRSAIIGGVLAKRAENNGWDGIVVYGCIKDVDDVNLCDIGVRALGSYPVKPGKKGNGEKHVPVTITGIRVCECDWLYADSDGILVSTSEMTA